ncbi:40S ribosomal protein S2 [Myotis brandtii]|uniref:40S ribosomal protein S2 n=1 Tax=Myotis brandtii TaxID=109478 RepID=S7NIX8_MYOBR|nr:40S ribosomal protein S2 [Myotis brandtii]
MKQITIHSLDTDMSSVMVCHVLTMEHILSWGTGIVSARVQASAADGWSHQQLPSARGCTGTLGNFAKATSDAISKTYSYLTPELWEETVFTRPPHQEPLTFVKAHTGFCAEDPGSSCGHHIISYKKSTVN